jgi:hypothetical protein
MYFAFLGFCPCGYSWVVKVHRERKVRFAVALGNPKSQTGKSILVLQYYSRCVRYANIFQDAEDDLHGSIQLFFSVPNEDIVSLMLRYRWLG